MITLLSSVHFFLAFVNKLDNSFFEDAHAQRPMDYSVYENIVYSYGIHVK